MCPFNYWCRKDTNDLDTDLVGQNYFEEPFNCIIHICHPSACPRYSESPPVYNTESPDVSSLKLTWRDWDVTVDRGIGPVTGYVLRHGKVGETQVEIQKGLTLHHQFTNLTINTDYSVEIIGQTRLCEGSASFSFNFTTGCGGNC